ncbi:hypothetical protein BLNAU_19576 [Blattamonas nauphoetae]|uniref:Uncharacterized protein n=1 Tax=Blattamonas nauphoetae TaxID=2049346 RepID=A0ABQ9X145_9EUKA|nr:hypothetical protein BLNAU_19576 [Blattamonas nauphoetae]
MPSSSENQSPNLMTTLSPMISRHIGVRVLINRFLQQFAQENGFDAIIQPDTCTSLALASIESVCLGAGVCSTEASDNMCFPLDKAQSHEVIFFLKHRHEIPIPDLSSKKKKKAGKMRLDPEAEEAIEKEKAAKIQQEIDTDPFASDSAQFCSQFEIPVQKPTDKSQLLQKTIVDLLCDLRKEGFDQTVDVVNATVAKLDQKSVVIPSALEAMFNHSQTG